MSNLTHLSIPVFIALIVIEVIVSSYVLKKENFELKDTFSSLIMGLGNVLVSLLTKGVTFGIYTFFYQFRFFDLEPVWWVWILLILADDFSHYWFHRVSHFCRFFWASHVVHHSSQKFNLSTALRQTWTGNLTGTQLFYVWMLLLGFEPLWVLTMHSINLLYQFWIHTNTIKKFPFFVEFIFNTPSHHRVHHSSEPKHLDMNLGGILIIWDRMFGTFVPEGEKTPVYGLTKNINTYNPIKIAFHEWIDIVKDVQKAPSIKFAIMYIFGPPGWSHDNSRKTSSQIRSNESKK